MLNFSTVIIVHVSKKFCQLLLFNCQLAMFAHFNIFKKTFSSKKVPVVHVRTLFFAVSFLLLS